MLLFVGVTKASTLIRHPFLMFKIVVGPIL